MIIGTRKIIEMRKVDTQKIKLYPPGLFEMLILDRFKYRGKGRPRKTDYSPFGEIQDKLTSLQRDYIEMKANRIWFVR